MESSLVGAEQPEKHGGWPEQLAVRVARCYYELGMTQQEVASSLGLGRARVIRLLAEARERGIVTIQINSRLLENVQLSEQLVKRFKLATTEVCISHPSDEHSGSEQLALNASEFVTGLIEDNMTIGLGWGSTLKALAERVQRTSCSDVSVVSMLGSLTQRSSIDRYEASMTFAAKLGAECFYLPAPIVCDSPKSRKLLVDQLLFREIHARALAADLAVVSIGGLNSSTIRKTGLVTEQEYKAAIEQGAVGNFLGQFIDKNANVIDQPFNQRIVGISTKEFKKLPRRIMVSAGENKIEALFAVLKKGLLTDLVTDARTAKALIKRGG